MVCDKSSCKVSCPSAPSISIGSFRSRPPSTPHFTCSWRTKHCPQHCSSCEASSPCPCSDCHPSYKHSCCFYRLTLHPSPAAGAPETACVAAPAARLPAPAFEAFKLSNLSLLITGQLLPPPSYPPAPHLQLVHHTLLPLLLLRPISQLLLTHNRPLQPLLLFIQGQLLLHIALTHIAVALLHLHPSTDQQQETALARNPWQHDCHTCARRIWHLPVCPAPAAPPRPYMAISLQFRVSPNLPLTPLTLASPVFRLCLVLPTCSVNCTAPSALAASHGCLSPPRYSATTALRPISEAAV